MRIALSPALFSSHQPLFGQFWLVGLEFNPKPKPFFFFGGFIVTEQEDEFEVSGFKPRDHGPRSDKGRKHNYPKKRKSWS
jgi:hypothetical protein